MNGDKVKKDIRSGNTSLGIEFGSTRIKAVLIGEDFSPIALGNHNWENELIDGVWTYSLDAIWNGLRDCYSSLKDDVFANYGITLESIGSIGISAMMHGYLVFDKDDNLLVPFRTWRNTITAESSEILVELFNYPIPYRWSISHLYQAIINGEPHVANIAYITTLAGYVHWQLTGKKMVGVGEASGMFPVDTETRQFSRRMIDDFDALIDPIGYDWKLDDLLPNVLSAGESAGTLTKNGAKLIDCEGSLGDGIPFCPPEGDAGTGMVATNSISPKTGNVSAGTSIFLMAVLEKDLGEVHSEINLVTTPAGDPVAMVHCNNCTGDIDAWVKIFSEFCKTAGLEISKQELYDTLYFSALEADSDCGGLLSYNYISGESITKLNEGRPLFVRMPDSSFSLANFIRTHLYSALATLKIGFDILEKDKGVKLEKIYGHGGFFKTERVGQQMMATALDIPITVMETAGEGGPWGMALLAAYSRCKGSETLDSFLDNKVFKNSKGSTIEPKKQDVEGFEIFMKRYREGLEIEMMAIERIRE